MPCVRAQPGATCLPGTWSGTRITATLCTDWWYSTSRSRGRGMSTSIGAGLIPLFVLGVACSEGRRRSPVSEANASIDSLNARLIQAYRNHDSQTYAALYTDSAVFEWPAFNTVRGRAGLEAMARSNWASLSDMDLQLIVSSRRVASNHATEFGAFQQSWRGPSGARMTEFGRYV